MHNPVQSNIPALAVIVALAGACGEAHPNDDAGPQDSEALDELGVDITEARTVGELRDLVPEEALPPELRDADDDAPVRVSPSQPGDEPSWDPPLPGNDQLVAEGTSSQSTPGCAAANINVPLSGVNGKQVSFATGTATSPNASYNPFGCPRRYITEVTGTYGESFEVVAEWGDTAPSISTCYDSYVNATTYGRRLVFSGFPLQIGYVWDTLGTEFVGGSVVAPFGTPVCVFIPTSPSTALEDSNYGVIRVAAQAYWDRGWLGKSYRRVTGGVD